jgi:Domain of unknown function (DU1801)
MAELKTIPTGQSVDQLLDQIEDERKRKDSYKLLELMKQATNLEPRMWGDSMIGFGSYHYKYKSGHEGDSFLTGFSPRKQNLVLYIMPGFEAYDELLKRLGKFTTGKSCLYIKRLEDVDQDVLKELVKLSVKRMAKMYP